MAIKLPHQSSIPPVDDNDVATKITGGGGGLVDRRVATDSNDVLVFEGGVDGSGNLINTGSHATTTIAKVNTVPTPRPGFFDEGILCTVANANFFRGAPTVEPSGNMTLSLWAKFISITPTRWLILKLPYDTSSPPYVTISLYLDGSNLNADVAVSATRYYGDVSAPIMPLATSIWYHMGMTYDSTSGQIYLYVDGARVGSGSTGGGAIDWGTNKDWCVGGYPANPSADALISDVRIADVKRSDAWFEDVWRRGAVNSSVATADNALLSTSNTYTKSQTVSTSTLTYGANIALDAALSNAYTVTLTGATAQLDNPTNLKAGQTIVIKVVQDGTGGRGLTFGSNWDFGVDGAPVLTGEAAGAMSLISGISDGTKVFASSKLGFTA